MSGRGRGPRASRAIRHHHWPLCPPNDKQYRYRQSASQVIHISPDRCPPSCCSGGYSHQKIPQRRKRRDSGGVGPLGVARPVGHRRAGQRLQGSSPVPPGSPAIPNPSLSVTAGPGVAAVVVIVVVVNGGLGSTEKGVGCSAGIASFVLFLVDPPLLRADMYVDASKLVAGCRSCFAVVSAARCARLLAHCNCQ